MGQANAVGPTSVEGNFFQVLFSAALYGVNRLGGYIVELLLFFSLYCFGITLLLHGCCGMRGTVDDAAINRIRVLLLKIRCNCLTFISSLLLESRTFIKSRKKYATGLL